MRDSNSPRSPRTAAWLVSAPLALVVGLGLARTVWGGPPAASEDPPVDAEAETATETETETDPAPDPTAATAAVLGGESPAELEPAAGPELSPPPAGASSLRSQMENGLAELGELAIEARADDDLVRATCVLDKQDRAGDVMELGTGEMLVIRDANTSEQARTFALEKLDAAALRVDKLVEEAKECAGQTGPEDEVDFTRNESDEPNTVPMAAPSNGLGNNAVPPPVDGGWPPAASPTE